MASSRRSAKTADPVVAALARALDAPPGTRWLVAFSGGLDSTVLLHAAAAAVGPSALLAVHVDHGLQPAAAGWPRHCAQQAAVLSVAFETHRLAAAPPAGRSVEEWAREQRYGVLVQAGERWGARALLTAHHADDQAETLLIRIARGTGPDGLAGIGRAGRWQGFPVLRPLLDLPRAQLLAHARRHGLRWVEDPSNADTRLLRNAIRHRVLPAIDAAAPAFRANLLRLAERLGETREALAALAGIDLEAARIDDGRPRADPASEALDAQLLAALPPARRAAALRLWLARLGLGAPSEAKLREIERQLVPGQGAYGCVLHQGVTLRRYRRRLQAVVEPARLPAAARAAEPGGGAAVAPACAAAAGGAGEAGEAATRGAGTEADARGVPAVVAFTWNGEPALRLPGYPGLLHFDLLPPAAGPVGAAGGPGADGLAPDAGFVAPDAGRAAEAGVSADWLRGRPLQASPGASAARLCAAPGGHRRSLKNLYQERGVPAWERRALPLVHAAGRLLYAAGIGMDRGPGWPAQGPRVLLRWEGRRV